MDFYLEKSNRIRKKLLGLHLHRASRAKCTDPKDYLKRASSISSYFTARKTSAFCNDKVIDLQQILESKHFRLLSNYKSPKDHSKLLLVSKRHAPTSMELSEEEVKDQHEFIQFIVQTLEKKKGLKTCSILTQEGFFVGQTEEHTHMHLIIDPSPLRFHLHHIDYATQKPRPQEEILDGVKELQKIFLDHE